MRKQFPGHFRPSSDDFAALWESAIIALDTNVFLNLYRYSPTTRGHFLKVLEALKDRLWIPYQVADEFFRNRLAVISSQVKAYKTATVDLKKIEAQFTHSEQHPFISPELLEEFSTVVKKVTKELTSGQNEFSKQAHTDPILDAIEKLFDGKIGAEMDSGELDAICKEGQQRYPKKIPPGYEDKEQPDPNNPTRGYGDLIIWKQILAKAKAENRSVIFVLNDRKEDWWTQHDGEPLAPRPELIKEFKSQTNGQCYLYLPEQFLKRAGEQIEEKVPNPILKEIEKVNSQEQVRPILISHKGTASELMRRTENDSIGKVLRHTFANTWSEALRRVYEDSARERSRQWAENDPLEYLRLIMAKETEADARLWAEFQKMSGTNAPQTEASQIPLETPSLSVKASSTEPPTKQEFSPPPPSESEKGEGSSKKTE